MNNKSRLAGFLIVYNVSFKEKFNLYKSYEILNETKKVNVILTIIVMVFGLLGNSLIVNVFSRRKFRVNSSNVFLLCLAVNDSLFFIVHFFEVNFIFIHQEKRVNSYTFPNLRLLSYQNLLPGNCSVIFPWVFLVISIFFLWIIFAWSFT